MDIFHEIGFCSKRHFDNFLKQTKTAQFKNVKGPSKQSRFELQYELSLIKIRREFQKLRFMSFFRVENVEKLHFGFRVLMGPIIETASKKVPPPACRIRNQNTLTSFFCEAKSFSLKHRDKLSYPYELKSLFKE